MANQLGDWGYFFGPKIIVNFITFLIFVLIIFAKILFLFASKQPKKMFYWINAMEYNEENGSFDKLNLNESDSKKFIKRLSLSVFLLRSFTFALTISYYLVTPLLIYKHQNAYYLNYFISILFFMPEMYYGIQFLFGILVILYPVS